VGSDHVGPLTTQQQPSFNAAESDDVPDDRVPTVLADQSRSADGPFMVSKLEDVFWLRFGDRKTTAPAALVAMKPESSNGSASPQGEAA
jgi:hypothetical protein